MPNYVYNTLHITGRDEDVAAATKQIDEHIADGGSFIDKFIPFPEAGQRQVEGGFTVFNDGGQPGTIDGYGWALKNWGTKWPDNHAYPHDHPNTFTFTTPWDTPDIAIKTISKMFPEAVFVTLSIEEQPAWRHRTVFVNGAVRALQTDYTPDAPMAMYESGYDEWQVEFDRGFTSIIYPADKYPEWELSPEGALSCAINEVKV
jgi:hypothetical protein